jgi:hypothetical protein
VAVKFGGDGTWHGGCNHRRNSEEFGEEFAAGVNEIKGNGI